MPYRSSGTRLEPGALSGGRNGPELLRGNPSDGKDPNKRCISFRGDDGVVHFFTFPSLLSYITRVNYQVHNPPQGVVPRRTYNFSSCGDRRSQMTGIVPSPACRGQSRAAAAYSSRCSQLSPSAGTGCGVFVSFVPRLRLSVTP